MAPVLARLASLARAVPDSASQAGATTTTQLPAQQLRPYPLSVTLAVLSLILCLLLLSPASWHYRNRNLGALLLVAWTILLNLQTFLNALLWSNDNIATWYNGAGLCDIEVKITVAWAVAAPACLAAVLRGLANAMDTSRVSVSKTRAQRYRDWVIDLAFCVGAPAMQMLFHYLVQPRRYVLFGITGCFPVVAPTALSVALIWATPVLWTMIDSYFALLILLRLLRYRMTIGSILGNSNMNKTRFLRLYIFCITLVSLFLPLQLWVLYFNLQKPLEPFVWSEIHDPGTWNDIMMIPSQGKALYTVYVWLGGGFFIFVFFGFGKDAVEMYRGAAMKVGLDKVFPSLSPNNTPRHSTAGMFNSVSSKAKLFLRRKSESVFGRKQDGGEDTTTTASIEEELSPMTGTFPHKLAAETSSFPRVEKGSKPYASRRTPLQRLTSVLETNRQSSGFGNFSLAGGPSAAQSATSGGRSVTKGSLEVIVRGDVRQDTEFAKTPSTMTGLHVV
ncbi:hypothetical protein LTR62_005251 [Meristemomyces frigidus]|uniref:Uncharacterized protein n=1 Tax=Meristemomyces frigidus TaxID=1508187 RepID=A0AAN7TEE4_9PEZI|nr:hypothetical protein LTR62_005251 [Meristemomyces frigidus]